MTCNSAVTFPSIDDTPTTSKVNVRLSGVKTTLKRVVVKLELSKQGYNEFDSIILIAEVWIVKVRNIATTAIVEERNRILAIW